MDCGEQCVITSGITMMLGLCADSWDTVSIQVNHPIRDRLYNRNSMDKNLIIQYKNTSRKVQNGKLVSF